MKKKKKKKKKKRNDETKGDGKQTEKTRDIFFLLL